LTYEVVLRIRAAEAEKRPRTVVDQKTACSSICLQTSISLSKRNITNKQTNKQNFITSNVYHPQEKLRFQNTTKYFIYSELLRFRR